MSATTDKIKGNWNVIKGQLKQQYAQLTDNDLTYVEGKEDELIGRLQKKLGQDKEQVHELIERLGTPTGTPTSQDDRQTRDRKTDL